MLNRADVIFHAKNTTGHPFTLHFLKNPVRVEKKGTVCEEASFHLNDIRTDGAQDVENILGEFRKEGLEITIESVFGMFSPGESVPTPKDTTPTDLSGAIPNKVKQARGPAPMETVGFTSNPREQGTIPLGLPDKMKDLPDEVPFHKGRNSSGGQKINVPGVTDGVQKTQTDIRGRAPEEQVQKTASADVELFGADESKTQPEEPQLSKREQIEQAIRQALPPVEDLTAEQEEEYREEWNRLKEQGRKKKQAERARFAVLTSYLEEVNEFRMAVQENQDG